MSYDPVNLTPIAPDRRPAASSFRAHKDFPTTRLLNCGIGQGFTPIANSWHLGIGSSGQLTMEWLQRQAGLEDGARSALSRRCRVVTIFRKGRSVDSLIRHSVPMLEAKMTGGYRHQR